MFDPRSNILCDFRWQILTFLVSKTAAIFFFFFQQVLFFQFSTQFILNLNCPSLPHLRYIQQILFSLCPATLGLRYWGRVEQKQWMTKTTRETRRRTGSLRPIYNNLLSYLISNRPQEQNLFVYCFPDRPWKMTLTLAEKQNTLTNLSFYWFWPIYIKNTIFLIKSCLYKLFPHSLFFKNSLKQTSFSNLTTLVLLGMNS